MTHLETIKFNKTTTFAGEKLVCVRGDRRVFADLSFKASSGELIILQGHNGSGKSSLLRIMAGLIEPREGKLLLNDMDVADEPAHHRNQIAYAGHLGGLKQVLSLKENLAHYIQIVRGTPADEGEMETAAGSLSLEHLLEEQLRYFSQGQTHRAALLKLVLSQRQIWLMDEPTVGLDADSRLSLARIMQQHLDSDGIIVAATHDPLGLKGRPLKLDDFRTGSLEIDHWLSDEAPLHQEQGTS